MEHLECEFGGAFPMRFPGKGDVKLYDCEGHEMEIPECEKCGGCKMPVIGKECLAWMCPVCPS